MAIRSTGILAFLISAGLMAQTKELDNFKVFIQEHPRALAELKKDPSLIRSAAFADEHQVVREYLEQHSTVKDELKKYPKFFDDLKATTPGGQHKPHPADK